MTRGLALFCLVVALGVGTLALPRPLGVACLAALVGVWLLTPIGGDE